VIPAQWRNRFEVRGVAWRQMLRWAVLNIPIAVEPIAIAFCALFFLLWGPGRRGVMRNLAAIKPGSSPIANFFRTYRVFWNYAWTIADDTRLRELGTIPDWEFAGRQHFDELLRRSTGSIMLTAHMGSYDLGAHLFAATSERKMMMVRAPEADPMTHAFEERFRDQGAPEGLRIGYNTSSSDLAFELVEALHRGEMVAIQGDRVTEGIGSRDAVLFGRHMKIPAGPFALAMATGTSIYPLFVMRVGRRRYRLVTFEPIQVTRTSRDREEALHRATERWSMNLEEVIRAGWQQWFTFEPCFDEPTAVSRARTSKGGEDRPERDAPAPELRRRHS
jgi:lauroyl/myristoyl acyltransferase